MCHRTSRCNRSVRHRPAGGAAGLHRRGRSVPFYADNPTGATRSVNGLGRTVGIKRLSAYARSCRYRHDPVENAIRPFAVGRRNWLFADTVAGANASARLYSLIECAKANGLEPYAYLRHVFTELPKAQSLADIEALLPTRLDPAALARDSLQELFPAARQ